MDIIRNNMVAALTRHWPPCTIVKRMVAGRRSSGSSFLVYTYGIVSIAIERGNDDFTFIANKNMTALPCLYIFVESTALSGIIAARVYGIYGDPAN